MPVCLICNQSVPNESVSRHGCLKSFRGYIICKTTGYIHPQKKEGTCLAKIIDNAEKVTTVDIPLSRIVKMQGTDVTVMTPETDETPQIENSSLDENRTQNWTTRRSGRKKLSQQDILHLGRLIDEVKPRKFLYDYTIDLKQRSALIKRAAWAEISRNLRIPKWTPRVCKTKWKFLRDGFRRRLKNLPSGSAAPMEDDLQEIEWPFMQRLLFLRVLMDEQPLDEISFLESTKTDPLSCRGEKRAATEEPSACETDETVTRAMSHHDYVSPENRPFKIKNEDDDIVFKRCEDILNKTVESAPLISTSPDELEGFFLFIKPKLLALQKRKRNRLLREFMNAVMEAEEEAEDF